MRQFGDRLLCVRYRYDKQRHKRLKTVEIIIEETEWYPEKKEEMPNRKVEVRVGYGEITLRKQVKAAGGKWNRKKGVWELPARIAAELGLESRIVGKKDTS